MKKYISFNIFLAVTFYFLDCSNRGLRSIKVDHGRKDSATVPLVEKDTDSTRGSRFNANIQSEPPPPPPQPETPKPAAEEENDDGKYFITRALLVIKQLPKSQARTRREVKARWKVRILMRKVV